MPIHIYECGDCGVREDYLVKSDQVPEGCANCGSRELERVYDGQTVSAHTSSRANGVYKPHLVPAGPLAVSITPPCPVHGGGSVDIFIPMKETFPTRDN